MYRPVEATGKDDHGRDVSLYLETDDDGYLEEIGIQGSSHSDPSGRLAAFNVADFDIIKWEPSEEN